MRSWRIFVAVTLMSCATPAVAKVPPTRANVPVPAAMQGVWGKNGRCDIPADRLTITGRTAGWGDGPFKAVDYALEDRALYWDQEYQTDLFVQGRGPDMLVHATEGWDMPGKQVYLRCGSDLRRLPWPSSSAPTTPDAPPRPIR